MVLQDKVVLITGAKGGLGHYVTEAFLAAGAKVVGVSRSIEAKDFPDARFTAIAAELSTTAQARAVTARALDTHGRVDALVHLVGGFAGGTSIAESDDATLDRMMEINFKDAFHMIQSVLPAMQAQRWGTILAIGSRTAVEPQPLLGAYSASKAALVSLIRTIALENKQHGISANVVLPGTMDTPANRHAMPHADPSNWVQPGQVAQLLVHLASSAASQITGAVIPIYGKEL